MKSYSIQTDVDTRIIDSLTADLFYAIDYEDESWIPESERELAEFKKIWEEYPVIDWGDTNSYLWASDMIEHANKNIFLKKFSMGKPFITHTPGQTIKFRRYNHGTGQPEEEGKAAGQDSDTETDRVAQRQIKIQQEKETQACRLLRFSSQYPESVDWGELSKQITTLYGLKS